MPSAEQIRAWVEVAKKKNYYEILRIFPGAGESEIKAAFHKFALRFHPDQLVDDGDEVVEAAAELFKRGVEAYNILIKRDLRERYDAGLLKGRLRMDIDARPSVPPPPPMRTLEMIAKTPNGKKYAAKADRLLSIGKLEDARVQLTTALQQEPTNAELQERINILYEALALEPG
ncbi:MAG: J domain-containing protein [Polyangiaceae bacterium]|jgi:curved DNA-binding protein CbpA